MAIACLCVVRAASIGDTKEEVLDELGSPFTKVEGNGRAVFQYSDGTRMVLVNDRVVELTLEPRRAPANHDDVIVTLESGGTLNLGRFSWKKLLAAFVTVPS